MCQILCLYEKVHNWPEISSYAAGLKWKTSTRLCIPLPLGTIRFQLTLRMLILAFPFFKPPRKFFRFKWSDQTYEFACPPLAPRIFTSGLKPVISHLRVNGYRVVIFLDGIVSFGSSVEKWQAGCPPASHMSNPSAMMQSAILIYDLNGP